MAKNKYKIENFMIVDQQVQPYKEIYIREILDAGCAQFELSDLSKQERLEIIEFFGIETLTDLLKECFRVNEKPYDATLEAYRAYEYFKGNRTHPLLNNTKTEVTPINNDIEKGRQQEAAKLFLLLVDSKFGSVSQELVTKIQQASPEEIEKWTKQIFQAETPEALLNS